MRYLILLTLLLASALTPSYAETGQEIIQFDTVAQHERYQTLLKQLRCLVCQNQSLADSGAGLADDLRLAVETQIRSGANDQEIIEFMVSRYGDFVLYNPPLKKTTILLWFLPYILIGLGGVAVIWFVIQRNENKADSKISEARRKRAAELLRKASEASEQDQDKD